MDESIIVTSSKETLNGDGIVVLDASTGTSICPGFKNCISGSGAVCMVGGPSSYAGYGGGASCYRTSSCDYFVAAQLKKPIINLYQWGKAQPSKQFYVQEIITVLTCDNFGMYLVGGTAKGNCYCWEIASGKLIEVWSAHHSNITKIKFAGPNFIVTTATDGHACVWDMCSIVDASSNLYTYSNLSTSNTSNAGAKRHITPFCSWCPHTLPIKDFTTIPSCSSSPTASPTIFRVLTVGMDQRIVCYDVYSNSTVFSVNLGEYYRTGGIESVVTSNTDDYIYCGCTNGSIYAINLSVVSMSMLKAHSNIISLSKEEFTEPTASNTNTNANTKSVAYVLSGHNKPITSLVFSLGLQGSNRLLVSGSTDGSVCTWDMWSKQCLKKLQPFGGNSSSTKTKVGVTLGSDEDSTKPITNVLICIPPEYIRPSSSSMGVGLTHTTKPTLTPFQTLKKYMSSNTTNTNAAVDPLSHDNLSIPLRSVGVGLVHTLALYGNEADTESESVDNSVCEEVVELEMFEKKKDVDTGSKRKRKNMEPSGITMFE